MIAMFIRVMLLRQMKFAPLSGTGSAGFCEGSGHCSQNFVASVWCGFEAWRVMLGQDSLGERDYCDADNLGARPVKKVKDLLLSACP